MIDQQSITKINEVIDAYFAQNPTLTVIPVKELMQAFVAAGIFKKDVKKGQPIRKVLRALDEAKQLDKIPTVFAERTETSIYWYFVPVNAEKPTGSYKKDEKKPEAEKRKLLLTISDRDYIMGLCDTVLGKESMRQKTFGFLLGDFHKNGKSQTRLPVDAYYEELNLVVEYKEKFFEKPVGDNAKPVRDTVSGMSRIEQRKRYDERRAEVLPEYGITLINIPYNAFVCNDLNKIERNEERDLKVVKNALKAYLDK